ncbi:MAG: polC [Planctomycetota bacterium]|nr:polC [Planctomycetota bacterium]
MTELPIREFVALDLETTGLSAETDRIVEVGAVRFDASGRDLGHFQSLVNPRRPVSAQARSIHGISDAELAVAPTADVVLPAFLAWLGETSHLILLAHNASFDAGFLGCEFARIGSSRAVPPIVDTLALARRRLPNAPNHRLDTLARLLGLDPDGPHRALADSFRVKGLWLALTAGPEAALPLASYPIVDRNGSPAVPTGWEPLAAAMASGLPVRIEYEGGTRGLAPRDITPRRFEHHGGVAYVVARCHADRIEKSFRLDRVLRFEVVAS